jgi:hypothetical protein
MAAVRGGAVIVALAGEILVGVIVVVTNQPAKVFKLKKFVGYVVLYFS